MNSRGLIIFFAIPILTITILLFINNAAFLGGVEQSQINQIKQQQEGGGTPSSQNSAPSDTDFISLFFQALQGKNTALSLGMLEPTNIKDDASLKEWQKYFTSFETTQVISVTPEKESSWTPNEHVFKVVVNVKMISEAASAAIPNYGWQNGDNIRWITVKKGADGLWRVLKIATGP